LISIKLMLSKTRLNSILSLKRKKYRDAFRKFLIEGYHLCYEALQSRFRVETLLIAPELLAEEKASTLIQLAHRKSAEVIEITSSDVQRLADTVNSQGIFAIVLQSHATTEIFANAKCELGIAIDAGQDPGNLGTVIRTCDWFGVSAVILGKGSVELYNPKVVRSTMGSIFHLPILEQVELSYWLPEMKNLGYSIYGADVNGPELYHQIQYPRPLIVVIGNENRGIGPPVRRHIDKFVKIPCYGKAESLNMAVAAALIISRIVN